MNFDFVQLAAASTDSSYWSGWDKVGAVAVAVFMMVIMMLLHRSGLKRVDKISDRHMAFVEAQTKVMTELVKSNDDRNEANTALHERIDRFLECRQTKCPVNEFLKRKVLATPPPGALP